MHLSLNTVNDSFLFLWYHFGSVFGSFLGSITSVAGIFLSDLFGPFDFWTIYAVSGVRPPVCDGPLKVR